MTPIEQALAAYAECLIIADVLQSIGDGDREVGNAAVGWIGEKLSEAASRLEVGLTRMRGHMPP